LNIEHPVLTRTQSITTRKGFAFFMPISPNITLWRTKPSAYCSGVPMEKLLTLRAKNENILVWFLLID
jgi:hypothetical protein